ncbi:MAG: hypothetical protein KC506_01120 [Nanoarchaeota archaeon]|nr:hypothetical protein [Nanoarchaeota archaeon]
MNSEIVAGLKNAVVRGQSLDAAAQSFKNAGYNPKEVDMAKNSLGGGVSKILPNAPAKQENSKDMSQNKTPSEGMKQMGQMAPMNPGANRLPSSKVEKKGGGKTALIIIVILLLLIFIGALGYLVYYLAV